MSAPAHSERVLADRVRQQDNGILTVTEGKARRQFCLQKGRLTHAASNIIEEQFDEYLVCESLINPTDRARSKLESKREGIPALDWLVQQDVIAADRLDAAIAQHAGALLLRSLASPEALADFAAGTPNLDGKAVTDRPLAPLLFELLEKYPKLQEIRTRVGRPDMLPVRVADHEDAMSDLGAERPELLAVWKHSEGDLNVAQLVRQIDGGEERGLRALYGLVLIGAVEAISADVRISKSAREVPVTRNELLARMDRAIDADHYAVLELMRAAKDDQIRSSYYVLARRYHPDRFRSSEHAELMPRIESFFAQVTEAYNTLSDSILRKNYDDGLEEAGARTSSEPAHDAAYLARQNFLRAKAVAKRKQFRQAVTFLENAVGLEENVPEYHVELGTLLCRNPRRRDEAEQHLRRGIELDPTVVNGHVALVDLLVKRDRHDQAVLVLTEAFKWFPDHQELVARAEQLGATKGRGLFGR